MDQLLPEWAQPFGDPLVANDYWDLVCEVAEARWGDDITLSYLEGSARHRDGRVAQFHNIARDAVDRDHDTQRRGLYNFLAMLDDMLRETRQLASWEWAAPRLRRRLQMRWDPPWPILHKSLDLHTDWIVALDTESGCAPVAVEWLADWGVSAETAWERASQQSLANPHIEVGRLGVDDDEVIGLYGDMCTSGAAMDLTQWFDEPLGDLGALVIAPTAHLLYAVPLRNLAAVADEALQLMVLGGLRMSSEPNPISQSLFWYRGPGRLEPCVSLSPTGSLRIDAGEPLRSRLLDVDHHLASVRQPPAA